MSRKLAVGVVVLFVISFITIQGLSHVSSTDFVDGKTDETTLASNPIIWHDDCSNTSSFPDLADSWYGGAMDSIVSSGSYIYATDFGKNFR